MEVFWTFLEGVSFMESPQKFLGYLIEANFNFETKQSDLFMVNLQQSKFLWKFFKRVNFC